MFGLGAHGHLPRHLLRMDTLCTHRALLAGLPRKLHRHHRSTRTIGALRPVDTGGPLGAGRLFGLSVKGKVGGRIAGLLLRLPAWIRAHWSHQADALGVLLLAQQFHIHIAWIIASLVIDLFPRLTEFHLFSTQ